MKKIKIIVLVGALFLLISGVSLFIVLNNNKTFFKDVYVGIQGQEIFIPKYSYFKEECCMTAAVFYSLRSEKTLKQEINEYMKQFKYFEDDSTYGYMKDELFIQEYDVINNGLYRKIVITY